MSIIQVLCASVFSIASLLFQYIHYHIFDAYLFSFFILLAVISIVPFLLTRGTLNFIAPKSQKLSVIADLWLKIRGKWKYITQLIILFFLSILLYSFKIFYIYHIIFKPILFSSAAVIASTGMLSIFISFTPAAIGIKEAAMSYTALLTGENLAEAAAVVSLDRAITIAWVFLLGFVFSFWYVKEMAKSAEKQANTKKEEPR